MRLKSLLPFFLLLILAGFLAFGLTLNPREIPSPLIDKPVPDFRLARLDDPQTLFSPEEMGSRVWLINVWASWCVACREEHPMLVEIARRGIVPIVGLNYKEARGDGALNVRGMAMADEIRMVIRRANAWLDKHGNPYELTVLDVEGRTGIDFGVYGVPETFIIDQKGRIRYKHTGPITPQVFETVLMPRINELNRAD